MTETCKLCVCTPCMSAARSSKGVQELRLGQGEACGYRAEAGALGALGCRYRAEAERSSVFFNPRRRSSPMWPHGPPAASVEDLDEVGALPLWPDQF